MKIESLRDKLAAAKEPAFRTNQILKAIVKDGVSSFSEISTLPKNLREELDRELPILSFEAAKILVSKDKRSIKVLAKLLDGNQIETVLISPKPGTWSACISSQIGCPLQCAFCATGTLGFIRNLTAEEITDQVLFWRQYLKKNNIAGNFSNIVYMGMGEPFINWQEVKKSLGILSDPEIFGFGSRSISISTAGIPAGIEALAQEFPQVNLAISLHFADDEKRSRFMRDNKRFSLDDLRKALKKYFEKTKRKVFVEYILLDKINDHPGEALSLATYLKSIGYPQLLHVNLIRYNQAVKECVPATKENTIRFKNQLQKLGVPCTIRKSLGQDIQGACGQLAWKK